MLNGAFFSYLLRDLFNFCNVFFRMNSKTLEQVAIKNFNNVKQQQEFIEDASRKSSIDARIKPLVDSINKSDNYFTTSSCSGRFLAFSQVLFLTLKFLISRIL